MTWWKKLVVPILGVGMLIALVFFGLAAAFGFAWVVDQVLDFFTPYWERHKAVYDPQLRVYRCLDKATGELVGLDPPCLVLTLKGRRAIERRTARCQQQGGKEEACSDEAWAWVWSKQPK